MVKLFAMLLVAWFGMGKTEIAEPKTEADCSVHKGTVVADCQAYVRAKAGREANNYEQCFKEMKKAGTFRELQFGKDLISQCESQYKALVAAGVYKTDEMIAAEKADVLDPAKVKAVSIAMDAANPVCPGKVRLFTVTVTMDDGSTKRTWEKPEEKSGKVDHGLFVLTSPNGEFKIDPTDGVWGYFSDPNPLKSLDGFVMQVALKDRPDVKAETVVPATYECMTGLMIVGLRGSRGVSNTNGGKGADATEAIAEVGIVATKQFPKLLVMKGVSAAGTFWYAGALGSKPRVEVRNQGGKGGGGSSNTNGWGFNGGDGGNGAPLEVRYDKRHAELVDLIAASAPGGEGGDGGGGSAGGGSSGRPGQAGPAPTKKAVDPKTLFKGEKVTLI